MNIDQRVTVLLAMQLGAGEHEIKPEQKLGEHFGVDSLDIVEIVMACEEEFDIAITDEEAEPIGNCGTVGDLIKLVGGKVAA